MLDRLIPGTLSSQPADCVSPFFHTVGGTQLCSSGHDGFPPQGDDLGLREVESMEAHGRWRRPRY